MTDQIAQERLQKAAVVIQRLKEKLASFEQAEQERGEPIAIVGMGCRFPGGAVSVAAFWELLEAGRDAVQPLEARWAMVGQAADANAPRWAGLLTGPVDEFDAAFFGISPREAVALDPQHRLLLEVGWEALEDAGIPPHTLHGSRTGVFIGACSTDYGRVVARQPRAAQDAYTTTGNLLSVAAGRLSYTWGLLGPCLTVDTACSSSLVVFHLACKSLLAKESDLALVGGVNLILSPEGMGALGRAQALSPEGRCKTFDALANGFARGEGSGLVVLKRLSDARQAGDRIWAVIRGSAVNQDGRSTGLTAPNVRSQEALLREALHSARLEGKDIGFVETHGTGTVLGDPIEVEALRAVVGPARSDSGRCVLGAVKTNLGHLEGAAGVAGLIKAVLALHHERIPQNLHFRTLNPRLRLEGTALALASEPVAWPRQAPGAPARPRFAGVSAFGMSGTNAHVVLEEAPAAPPRPAAPARSAELVVLSARSPAALDAQAARLGEHLAAHPALPLGDLAFSAATTRSPMEHRLAIVAATRDGLREALAAAALGQTPAGVQRGRAGKQKVVFVFPGQGGQWLGMGRQLVAEEPVFRASIEVSDLAIRAEAGWSVREELAAGPEGSRLLRIEVVQPVLFAVEVALAALWRSWGVEPDVVVGHSMGEVAAAHVAGALTLADAVSVICRRSRLLSRISGQGEMAVVELTAAEAAALLAGYEDRLSVAASNAPRSTVISGDPAALGEVLAQLAARDVFGRRVKVDVASHSPQVEPLGAELASQLSALRPERATRAMRSTVTGAVLEGPELRAGYWMANLREPVRFSEVVEGLMAEGHGLFVEMSPHPVLSPMVEEIRQAGGRTGIAVGSQRREQDERPALLESLGALWVRGQHVAWDRVFAEGGRRVSLPTYPWQHERYWIDIPAGRTRSGRSHVGEHPLLGCAQTVSTLAGVRLWETTLEVARLPWLEDHRVHGVTVFPGAGYLEMALAAGRDVLGTGPVEVAEVTFVEALALSDEAILVQVVTTEAAGQLRFQIASKQPDAAHAAWTVHAHGRLCRANAAEASAGLDLASVRARLGTTMPGSALYAAFDEAGIQYGPAFRGITELETPGAPGAPGAEAGEALARVQLPEAAGSAGAFQLHPALLDACFQSMAGAVRSMAGTAWMPVAVGALQCWQRPSGELFCHARIAEAERSPGAVLQRSADLRIVDAAGAPVAQVSGLVVQQVRRARGRAQDDWFLALDWEPAAVPTPRVHGGRFLLLGDGGGLGAAVARALEAQGHTVVQAASGAPGQVPAGSWPVNDADAASIRALLGDAFGGQAPSAVVHVRSLEGSLEGGDGLDATAVEAALVRGCDSALATVQALAGMGYQKAPRLWLVTRGAQAVGGGEVAVAQAPLLGLGRVIAAEHPELGCARIDLEPAGPADLARSERLERDARALIAELLGDEPEQEIALRAGARHVARIARRLPEADPREAGRGVSVRRDGSYLVTGGLGGLGLRVAGWLAAQGAGQVVLVGRSGAASASQQSAVAALEAEGTRMMVANADVADRAQLARVLDRVAASGLPLAGVIHAAGVLDDGLLRTLDRARLRGVMAPKIDGACNLHELTRALPLDFFVLYASAAGFIGLPGQGNYAAANTFLDALAHRRRAEGLPALSIDWGGFSEVGLAAAQDNRGARLAARGARSLTPEEGLAALARLLESGSPQAAVAPIDMRQWAAFYPAAAASPMLSRLWAGEPAGAPATATEEPLLARLAGTSPGERAPMLLGWLRGEASRVLHLAESRLDEHTALTSLGMDSLMGLELKHRVKRATDVDIPMAQILRDMSVAELAQILLARLPAWTGPEAEAQPRGTWVDTEL